MRRTSAAMSHTAKGATPHAVASTPTIPFENARQAGKSSAPRHAKTARSARQTAASAAETPRRRHVAPSIWTSRTMTSPTVTALV